MKAKTEVIDYANNLKEKKYLRRLNQAKKMLEFIDGQLEQHTIKIKNANENLELCRLEFNEAFKDCLNIDQIKTAQEKYQKASELVEKSRREYSQLSTFIQMQTQKTDFFADHGGFDCVLSKFKSEIRKNPYIKTFLLLTKSFF